MTMLNDDIAFALIIVVMILLVLNSFFHFFSWPVSADKSVADRASCPSCGRFGAENSGDQLVGIFQKSEERYYPGLRRGGGYGEKMAWYEKYKVQYKCKYCGHEWTIYKVLRQ